MSHGIGLIITQTNEPGYDEEPPINLHLHSENFVNPDPSIMKAAMLAFQGEPRDVDQPGPDGSKFVMRRSRSPGIERTLEQVAQDGTSLLLMTFYHPSQEPHESYPRDMPFVPNHSVVVGGLGSDYMLIWPNDASGLFDAIADECRRSGWTLDAEDQGLAALLLRTTVMRRDGATRQLFSVTAPGIHMITLT